MMDRKIDFMIIGAQKCGTTTLHDWVAQHPEIVMPSAKDILFFVDAGKQEVKPAQFGLYYPERVPANGLVGGSQVQHLYFEESLARLARYNPRMKLIAVLRNPIDRAYSSYWFARLNIWEPAETFEQALSLEPSRLQGTFREQADLTYLSHGHYADQLEIVYTHFSPDNMRVFFIEDLKSTPETVLRDLFVWLGLAEPDFPINISQSSNVAGVPKSRFIQRILNMQIPLVRDVYHACVPRRVRQIIINKIIRHLLPLNRRPQKYPAMSESTRDHLRDYFAPHNKRLEALLGRDLSHWN